MREKIYKALDLSVKDIDTAKRDVAFYIAKFNSVDLHGDMFTKDSMTWNPRDLKHFLNHDNTKPVGVIQSIQHDDIGYFAVSKLSKADLGNQVAIWYEEGIINQHSVGGYIENGKQQKDFYEIETFELFEVSSLTHWGAQPDTPLISQKHKEKQNNLWDIYLQTKYKF
jgi:HK97 family phage prohead protease